MPINNAIIGNSYPFKNLKPTIPKTVALYIIPTLGPACFFPRYFSVTIALYSFFNVKIDTIGNVIKYTPAGIFQSTKVLENKAQER